MRRSRAIALILILGLGSAHGASFQSLFAPQPDLWERWTAHDEDSAASINHATWSAFLARYRRLGEDGIALLAYRSVTLEDHTALNGYIDGLARLAVGSYSRNEQFAYWVNLYNALTVRVVLEAYPVDSIRDVDISPGLFADGPWDAELVTVEGEAMTLNDIEHRILRPIWNDPRIHYAVNCASLGCPNLAATAYTGAGKEAMLNEAARLYVNSARGARVENGDLIVSRIYDWFDEDFGDEADIITHLRQYAEPQLDAALAEADGIDGYVYDWALNDTR